MKKGFIYGIAGAAGIAVIIAALVATVGPIKNVQNAAATTIIITLSLLPRPNQKSKILFKRQHTIPLPTRPHHLLQ
ncbi:hypothetical protein NVIE_1444 [Nitrososphaera viennensis EN76]|uniref:Uncharacterized protein n=1 Tax=Nitrososphaera viennensis EN76 TaxID=926571 RepID=A0A060HR49_9ARCH|nr:hypothetical protein NVIE_1444 [Nitrososphaera viennensis EN76]